MMFCKLNNVAHSVKYNRYFYEDFYEYEGTTKIGEIKLIIDKLMINIELNSAN